MRKASTWMLEKGTQTPSPSPDHIPAEHSNETLMGKHTRTGTSNGGTSAPGTCPVRRASHKYPILLASSEDKFY